ncbi:hypothetical protein CN918_30930 [Priestia megaterium]|nr:hypothetical protein CN918_30930 [Priestia megaterium]
MSRFTKGFLACWAIILLVAGTLYLRYYTFAPEVADVEGPLTSNDGSIKFVSQTLRYKGDEYNSLPDKAEDNSIEKGAFIGNTTNGVHVYKAKNHPNKIIVSDFMYPPDVYTKIETKRP